MRQLLINGRKGPAERVESPGGLFSLCCEFVPGVIAKVVGVEDEAV